MARVHFVRQRPPALGHFRGQGARYRPEVIPGSGFPNGTFCCTLRASCTSFSAIALRDQVIAQLGTGGLGGQPVPDPADRGTGTTPALDPASACFHPFASGSASFPTSPCGSPEPIGLRRRNVAHQVIQPVEKPPTGQRHQAHRYPPAGMGDQQTEMVRDCSGPGVIKISASSLPPGRPGRPCSFDKSCGQLL
jgi:hypothetical protein